MRIEKVSLARMAAMLLETLIIDGGGGESERESESERERKAGKGGGLKEEEQRETGERGGIESRGGRRIERGEIGGQGTDDGGRSLRTEGKH